MAKSFKKNKKSIVAGSPAINDFEQERQLAEKKAEQMAQQSASDSVVKDNLTTQQPQSPVIANEPEKVSVFSRNQVEATKNVQTRIPLSMYDEFDELRKRIYVNGSRASIGELMKRAIGEYIERHRND